MDLSESKELALADLDLSLPEVVSKWLSLHKEKPVTPQMMVWMKCYDAPCGRPCCYSTECATVKCSNCNRKLSLVPPLPRFVCLECPLFPTGSLNGDWCTKCFNSPSLLHPHKRFLQVDAHGVHIGATRLVGIASKKQEISVDDFKTLPLDALPPSKNGSRCTICYDDFFDDDLPTVALGCRERHKEAFFNSGNISILDLGGYSHATCRLHGYQNRGMASYYVPDDSTTVVTPNYCNVCIYEDLMNSWEQELTRPKKTIFDYFNKSISFEEAQQGLENEGIVCPPKDGLQDSWMADVQAQLLDLHKQASLVAIIKKIYSATP